LKSSIFRYFTRSADRPSVRTTACNGVKKSCRPYSTALKFCGIDPPGGVL
jgi:hypothetical protein